MYISNPPSKKTTPTFSFKIKHICLKTRARTGIFKTPHGDIKTPVFIPIGTKACVKTLTPEDLENLNTQIILANTYHLAMRPGADLIKKMGGLHKWMNWNKPILTDSGGFQVFSLGKLNKITEEGVEFKSYLDGSCHFFTPELAIEIQEKLGADIIMAFDECAPASCSKDYAKKALERTHNWAIRCKKAHKKKNQALFPIIQGTIYKDLRIKSTKFMADLNLPGIAIGGLSVGETRKQMYEVLETIEPYLPKEKPRYLMGVGTPKDIIESVARGIDMFDCVLPTRLARHGSFLTKEGQKIIRNEQFKFEKKPLEKSCKCITCQNFSASYLRHLFAEKEITALRLITIHNLHFLLRLMEEIQDSIEKGNFEKLRNKFKSSY